MDYDEPSSPEIGIAIEGILRDRLQLSRLVELCRLYSVRKLTVFGSALRPDFESKSDIDFVVEFSRSSRLTPSRQYFDFAEDLESLYERPVDLVMRGGIKNPVFRE